MAAKIEIYTWSNCPFCVRAKELFKRKGVAFTEIDLDGKDDELNALRTRTGYRTIPQIFINDQMMGGFNDIADLDSKGELDKLLK
jgi:glutaredoxin 3